MVSIKKIVCALDLSDLNTKIADYAVSLAKMYDAEILVIYASPPLTQYAAFEVQPKAFEMFVEDVSAGAERNMERAMNELFSGVKAKAEVMFGNPAEEILRAAKDADADLIIMGSHGRKGVDLLVIGSVSQKVVKNSKIPVLTIHPD